MKLVHLTCMKTPHSINHSCQWLLPEQYLLEGIYTTRSSMFFNGRSEGVDHSWRCRTESTVACSPLAVTTANRGARGWADTLRPLGKCCPSGPEGGRRGRWSSAPTNPTDRWRTDASKGGEVPYATTTCLPSSRWQGTCLLSFMKCRALAGFIWNPVELPCSFLLLVAMPLLHCY